MAFNKWCVFIVMALAVCIVFIGLIFGLSSYQPPATDEQPTNLCLEPQCTIFAGEYLNSMNLTADPCDDFHNFVCGNYPTQNPRPDDKNSVSPTTRIIDVVEYKIQEILEEPVSDADPKHRRNFKSYYQSCIDTWKIEEIGLGQVKEVIKMLGGWPVVEDLETDLTWEQLMIRIFDFGLTGNYILDLTVDVDLVDTTKYTLLIAPPESQMKRAYLVKGRSGKQVEIYYDFMVDVAKLFGADEEKAKMEMSEALDFEIALANASKSPEELVQNFSALYNIYTIDELEGNFTGIKWHEYITKASTGAFEIPRSLHTCVSEPDYVNTLISLIRKTSPRTVRNLLMFRVVWNLLSLLDKKSVDLWWQFNKDAFGAAELMPRKTRCLKSTAASLYITASAEYVRRHFDGNSKKSAETLVDYIKDAFREILGKAKWSKEDKKNALEKIDAVYTIIGYPNEILNDTLVEDYYKSLELVEGEYMKSYIRLAKFLRGVKYAKLFEKVDRKSWKFYSKDADVNAYYKHDLNALFFPAGNLQGLYFNKDVPKYVNFGAIGTTMGHEVSHGFDHIGQQFDKEGATKEWWSQKALNDFLEKQSCLIEQYDMYSYDGLKINGELTVGENLADLNGWKTAYSAYQKWLKTNGKERTLPGLNFTNNQMFWIAGAATWCGNDKREAVRHTVQTDEHAPDEFRVNGPLSNLDIFATDFKCKPGSKMNPVKKCAAW